MTKKTPPKKTSWPEYRLSIKNERDVALAIAVAMNESRKIGFAKTEQCMIATSVSELARNIVRYAGKGAVLFQQICHKSRPGIKVTAVDKGPGIENIELAMRDYYTTSKNSLGVGLPGVKRLMDEFSIESKKGTKVTVRKWVR